MPTRGGNSQLRLTEFPWRPQGAPNTFLRPPGLLHGFPGFGWCVLTPLVSGQVREHQALQDVALPGI